MWSPDVPLTFTPTRLGSNATAGLAARTVIHPKREPMPQPNFTLTQFTNCSSTKRVRLLAVLVASLGILLPGCGREGKNNQDSRYVGSASQQAKPAPLAKSTVYKCPMHPNVTSDKPGKCSVCGMNLEPASHSHGDSSLAMQEAPNVESCTPASACSFKN